MKFQDIQQRFALLLEECREHIKPEQHAELIAMVQAGEPGIALEIVATQLHDQDIAVSAAFLEELRTLGQAMKLDEEHWTQLKVR
jgi:hypothetical protein